MQGLRLVAATLLLVVLGLAVAEGQDGPSRNTWDGIFTAEQAERGVALADEHCVMCHAANLRGSPGAPPIAGNEFLFIWSTQSAASLFDYVKANMPPLDPGGLSDQEYADVVAAIFESSGFPGGDGELAADADALADIQILRTDP
jgi:mono/diheme cytochrome c family protein